MTTMASRLKEARERAGLTTREAAARLGCSQPWIVNLERSDRSVTLAWAARFADLYGVTTDWLAGRDV
jgi:transcriptional regulator with XRE-family HTH domain